MNELVPIKKTATFVKRVDWQADAALYRLSESVPVGHGWADDDASSKRTSFVIVSAVNCYSVPETLIFPATEDGEAINMLEIAGGRGYMDHKIALEGFGFEIVKPEPKRITVD